MDRLYPGLGEHLEGETTVAIDGAIHETAYFQPIREGCEIFFIQKLEGVNPAPSLARSPTLQLITTRLSEVGAFVSLEVLSRPKRFRHKARIRFRIRPAPRHQLGRDHRCFIASTAL